MSNKSNVGMARTPSQGHIGRGRFSYDLAFGATMDIIDPCTSTETTGDCDDSQTSWTSLDHRFSQTSCSQKKIEIEISAGEPFTSSVGGGSGRMHLPGGVYGHGHTLGSNVCMWSAPNKAGLLGLTTLVQTRTHSPKPPYQAPPSSLSLRRRLLRHGS